MLLIDTHALIWLRSHDRRLGPRAREVIDSAWRSDSVAVSVFTFWELAMLRAKQRISWPGDVSLWRQELLNIGIREIALDGEICIRANFLLDFPADPADRLIVATALEGHQLITADDRILRWQGDLSRLDARR